ncbi:MAG: septum formation initiator family protein [Candidatus Doudnabacteria bacterium]|nr:septum formation initiator family protein [Candidatus Doudnabacteria bacterium]
MSVQDFLQSKIGTAVLILGLIFVLVIAIKLMSQKSDVESEIDKLQEQSDKISKENAELAELINYLKTDTYKERQAREQLNLKKEGEHVVVLPKIEDLDSAQSNTEKISNPRKWINYFFQN